MCNFYTIFLFYGTYARRESVIGFVVPDKGLVKIYAPLQGEIYKQHVKEGQVVVKDDLLFTVKTLNQNNQGSDRDALLLGELQQQKIDLENKIAQEKRLNESSVASLEKSKSGTNKELEELEKNITLHKKQRELASHKLDNLNQLSRKGHIATNELKLAEQQVIDSQVRLQTLNQQKAQLNNKFVELAERQKQLPLEWESRQLDYKRNLSEIEQRIVEISGRREYAIRAPIGGRLTALQVSEGQTLNTQSPIVAILPEDAALHAELFLPTRAAGFIAEEQEVLLRYGTFPYQHYGLHKGKVSNVAQVILAPNELPIPVALNEPVYRVKVELDSQVVSAFGKELPLQAGMLLDADIVLETRTLGQWLLEPIYGLRGKL